MRLLFVGDIVGKPGRACLEFVLSKLTETNEIDCIVVNGENAAGGMGITSLVFQELKRIGVDVVTGGNHIWDNKDIFNFIDEEPTLIRPANYPAGLTPGRGFTIFTTVNGLKIGILNLAGRVFMQPLDCPFQRADEAIAHLKKLTHMIVVDFHAEATAEKQALGWYLDGQVSAVLGTHTHVQTADERILPGGTAYITDAGMTGLHHSILGVDRDQALQRFLTQLPQRFKISKGEMQCNGVLVDIDQATGLAKSIKRINEVI